MKTKKLLKRIINARLSKKETKKVKKHNRKFFDNLFVATEDIDSHASFDNEPRTAVLSDAENKKKIFEYVKNVIASGDTDLNESKVNTKPLKSFEISVFTFEFENDVNPYTVLSSKDINIDELKSLTVSITKKESVSKFDTAED